jgi:hypothetical protein
MPSPPKLNGKVPKVKRKMDSDYCRRRAEAFLAGATGPGKPMVWGSGDRDKAYPKQKGKA